ncbi:N-acetylmuramoyl-L-alanine amidase [Caloramator proteoclasticus DSM 10124]|uniref:N-acetylmuramoyl-L-alanine amidase n=1 Tax=Caloramator proteoclasticus DSM 10124 TaxID=1121262 RepID=A0A1M4WHY9_9CLOT|nr:N-acetylmuramoyl-L-alanine amidase [Caloramator proteoclasticus DSM 10124]
MLKFYRKVTCLLIAMLMSSNIVFAGMLDGKKIVLDAGHGGDPKIRYENGKYGDVGASVNNIYEKNINIAIVEKLSNILKNFGADIIYTREPNNDVAVTLEERVKIANSNLADMFISIHNNKAIKKENGKDVLNTEVSGTEVFYTKYVEYNGKHYIYKGEVKEGNIVYVNIQDVEGNKLKVEKTKVKILEEDRRNLAKLVVDSIASLGFKNRGAKQSEYYVTRYTTMPSILIEAGFMSNPEELKKLTNSEMQQKIAFKIADAVYRYYEDVEKSNRLMNGFIKNLKLNISSRYIFVGQVVTLKLDGIENFDEFVYKVQIKKDGQVIYEKDYGNDFSINFNPDSEGFYDVNYFIKKKDSENEYDDKIGANFIVFKLPSIKSISADSEKVYVDKPIKIKADVENGSYDVMSYKFDVYLGQKLVTTVSNSDGILQYVPKAEGEYRVICYVKDKLSSSQFDDKKEIKFKVERQQETSRGASINDNDIKRLLYSRDLSMGSQGTDVTALQLALKKLGYYKANTTSLVFDNATYAAVTEFQKANALKDNGTVDRQTINKINELLMNLEVKNTSNQTNTTNSGTNIGVFNNSSQQLTYTRILKYGVSGQDVKKLQDALKKLGYLKITATTTYFGSSTKAAVVAFQKANKLPVADGMVDKSTINKINELLKKQATQNTANKVDTKGTTTPSRGNTSQTLVNNKIQLVYTRPLRLGTSGQDVKNLQEALKRLGYLKITTTTTFFGPSTETALRAFQSANKLTVDGIAGPNTIKVINQKLK